jgi:ABC-type polysaccharide/polyol phosphate export permease
MTSTKAGPGSSLTIYDAKHRHPPIRPYLERTYHHLDFAVQKAKFDLKAAHKATWLGRLWNVLNPMLLGLVYWLLVDVIFSAAGDAGGFEVLAAILAGLFLFQLPSSSLSLGARSIVGGGGFILNTRLPRLLLPMGAVLFAVRTFLPSMLVYAVFQVLAGFPITWQLLWTIPLICILIVMCFGLATVIATLTVYFRDIASFLPYIIRIWLYLSPVIWFHAEAPARIQSLIYLNPIGAVFSAWQDVLFEGQGPTALDLGVSVLWAVVAVVVGFSMFIRRERDFAIRM